MKGRILLIASEFISNQSRMLDCYKNIKDQTNILSERPLSVTKAWQGMGNENWMHEFNNCIYDINKCINSTLIILNLINDTAYKIKDTQLKVDELIDSLKRGME